VGIINKVKICFSGDVVFFYNQNLVSEDLFCAASPGRTSAGRLTRSPQQLLPGGPPGDLPHIKYRGSSRYHNSTEVAPGILLYKRCSRNHTTQRLLQIPEYTQRPLQVPYYTEVASGTILNIGCSRNETYYPGILPHRGCHRNITVHRLLQVPYSTQRLLQLLCR
jgi:hypothetical protein